MRILFVSNYYPPHFIGGYELGCRDIVESLRRREHETLVLTSTYGVSISSDKSIEPGIRRQLQLDDPSLQAYYPVRYLREFTNRRKFRAALSFFQPDLIYFWNQTLLPGVLVKLAHQARIPYTFYISDDTFLQWRTDLFWRRWMLPASTRPLKAAVKNLAGTCLRKLSLIEDDQAQYYRPKQFTSRYVQGIAKAGTDDNLDRVIPWGVDLERFSYHVKFNPQIERLLYVGQIEPHKGTHTAVQAVAILRNQFGLKNVSLTIVGGASQPSYLAQLNAFIEDQDLVSAVRFTGKIDRQKLPNIYERHDVLVFTSIWEEPFAITPLEAMACGLAIIGTVTGGSREIFDHGKNAMIFPPDDAAGCAEAICAVISNQSLYGSLREQGRRLVEQRYSLVRMVASIEQHAQEVVQTCRRP